MDGNNSTVLDVEDDDQRQNRIQNLLKNLNSDSKPQAPPNLPRFDFGSKSMLPVHSHSELLSRVQAFLPQIQSSNEVLNQRMQEDPTSVNIEHINEDMDHYIQMNLGLGVFEDRSNGTQDNHDTVMSSASSSSASSSSSEEVDQDSDIDSDASSEIITSFVPVRPIKPLPRRSRNRTRPQIVVLEEKSQE